MKLKLKHLDFANNCKVRLTRMPHWDFENVNIQDCELSFNSSSKEPCLRYRDVTFGLDQIKLYRRPLSDLTKEIEVNGEKFVPIELNAFKHDKDSIIDFINGFRHYKSIKYGIIERLLEWHFDIFNLIENNLAIDINTLSTENESRK